MVSLPDHSDRPFLWWWWHAELDLRTPVMFCCSHTGICCFIEPCLHYITSDSVLIERCSRTWVIAVDQTFTACCIGHWTTCGMQARLNYTCSVTGWYKKCTWIKDTRSVMQCNFNATEFDKRKLFVRSFIPKIYDILFFSCKSTTIILFVILHFESIFFFCKDNRNRLVRRGGQRGAEAQKRSWTFIIDKEKTSRFSDVDLNYASLKCHSLA